MFSLQLFGGASIRQAGEPLRGPVTQRRRLALLALLGVSSHNALSRDKLIGYLWPESDTDRARHLLSEALYVIRKALGEGALLTPGDEVRLDQEVVTSDVNEFGRALDQAEYERAITLYSGAFLDGFFLSDAPEFERWAEQERARLASCQQKALEAVAQRRQAAADLSGAADAWRQLARTDPYNSRVALQLMQALAGVGDRAGALQHARMHAILLWDEFRAEPDPEIAAYAERLRTEPAPAASSAPSGPFGEAVTVDTGSGTAELEIVEEAATAPSPLQSPVFVGNRNAGVRRMIIFGGGVVLALLAGSVVLRSELGDHFVPNGSRGRALAADEHTIAVLPFLDLSPERDHEWFSDGLSEEIINSLARRQGLQVAARTSSFSFRGKDADVREIGKRLGVAYVVEGSLRRAGTRLRVTAQLIAVRNGYHLWSETFERDLEDLFAVQDEISQAIVATLLPRLAAPGAAPRPPTADLEAYNLYLQGRYFWNKRNEDGLARGMELFQEAITRDPAFARPYAGLADSYALLVGFGALSPHEGYPRAKAAAEQALALDPSLGEAHASLALVKLHYERDWAAAGALFQRAIELSPSYPTARQWYSAYLAYQGKTEAALAEIARARQLDPLSLSIWNVTGAILYFGRRYEAAIEEHRRVLEMEPAFWPARAHLGATLVQQGRHTEGIAEVEHARQLAGDNPIPTTLLAYAYARAGRRSEARALLALLEEQAEQRYVSPVLVAAVHVGLGETDAALEWLARGYEARDDWMIWLRVEPAFDPLRSEPRFAALLARVGP